MVPGEFLEASSTKWSLTSKQNCYITLYMEIYQLHHINLAKVAALSPKNSQEIAKEILEGEVASGKNPPENKNDYVKEIAKCIDRIRNGEEMRTLGIDFPHTGLETDPICHACQQCPTMRDREDVEEMYTKRIR